MSDWVSEITRIYKIFHIFFMVKTIRIVDHKLHSELLKIQGEMQAKSGDIENMDAVIKKLLIKYGRKIK